jgi:predicted dehydrogenase
MDIVRIGCLGAARIVPDALAKPAKASPNVEFRAIAARDPARAASFARKHDIPVIHSSYEELIADESLDAVYIPLPNSLHAEWSIRALESGRHVLCEKPFSANAAEAARVQKVADATGFVVMEAFHWRYHPLATRMLDIVGAGELGTVRRIEAAFCFPLFKRGDIRWQLDLAGGAMMDAGCYPAHMVRTLAGAEPEVKSARADLRSAGVDRSMRAELLFEDGRTGGIAASMWSAKVLRISVSVVGDAATMHVINPLSPHMYHRLTVKGVAGTRREHVNGSTTYSHQLRAFAAAVTEGTPVLTPPSDSVANMQLIDDVYRAAGLEPRRGATD